VGAGRRQLQAQVRLRTKRHSSGPSSPGAQRGTHRSWPRAGVVMPGWTDARIRPAPPPPARNGTFTWRTPRFGLNHPGGCGRCIGTVQWGVHNKNCL
jgi:hypothetical protein